jgi:hypothetical protein
MPTWTRSPGVRLRPVPEQGLCLAYIPHPPRLYGLNPPSWLLLSLCDGRPDVALAAAYRDSVEPVGGPAAAPSAFANGLGQLQRLGLIRRTEEETCQ